MRVYSCIAFHCVPSVRPSIPPSLAHLDTLRHIGRVVRAELTVLLPD